MATKRYTVTEYRNRKNDSNDDNDDDCDDCDSCISDPFSELAGWRKDTVDRIENFCTSLKKCIPLRLGLYSLDRSSFAECPCSKNMFCWDSLCNLTCKFDLNIDQCVITSKTPQVCLKLII